jgi:hypothetical protein
MVHRHPAKSTLACCTLYIAPMDTLHMISAVGRGLAAVLLVMILIRRFRHHV